ncbi:heavy metal sensor histidine kinase [Rahnella aquatilis]|uniref:Sensor protein n=1 Tax=Rahnella aquatilis (strain ATCC 33071 / DSM 4594 / JCM 1683 / NBRC 105701 / NCIMB 13365 / CIP 78.65) TaxID=745277 RepID=H2IQM1_RAHAC|nr:heavy metal sensor histidine kinase [Rahnella aquatilis]AEX51322.1 heavy metal sensor kinase [Rahnella aquatilis CIP 78.65 = ATCC 33071]
MSDRQLTHLPKRAMSLTLRATLLFALIASLVVSAVGFYLYYSMDKELVRRADYQVSGRVQYFRHLLANEFPLSQLSRNPGLFENMLGNERDILTFGLSGEKLLINVNPSRLALPPVAAVADGQPLTLNTVHHLAAPDGTPVRFARAAVKIQDGRTVEITGAHFMTEESRLLQTFRWEIIGAVLFAYLLIAALGYLVIRRGLRPLRNMAHEAAQIHPASLSTRLSSENAPQELQQLIYSFNDMLDRLAEGYQRLTQFSADLAHEIRTPVGALMGHCQVALYQPRTVEEYETLLANNMEELERISRMVENILFLARASDARSVLTITAIDVSSEMIRIQEYFEGLAEERGMTLGGKGAGVLHADAILFQRALSNLVANAVRYGREGSAILLRAEPQGKGMNIHVISQGEPVPPEKLGKLFDRFYRADASRSEGGSSSGLGLSIVQAIMALHQGSVSVTSSPQGETCFTLSFPAADHKFSQ